MPNYINSVWSEAKPTPPQAPLEGNLIVDDAVVGGGITGITTALLLARAGRRVVVLEARRIGKGETGKTTAHLTETLDVPYHALAARFGVEGARLAAAGQREAIERVAAFCDELGIDCGFHRLPGYLYVERREELGALDEETDAALTLGLGVTRLPVAPLPFPTAGALRWDNQAALHPRAYLAALAGAFEDAGGRIAEETQVVEIDDADLCRVITDRGTVLARDVIVAAHVPISNRIFLHAKLAAYRTYVLGLALPDGASDGAGGLYWDMSAPYHYIRNQTIDGRSTLIVGGEDHKVGDGGDTIARFDRLEAYVRHHFHRDPAATDHRWSGQIVRSADGLPYVGRNAMSGRVFVATGYGGNGITQGTLAGLILSDLVLARDNRYAELLDATRVKPLASARAVIAENVDYPKHLITDRLRHPGPEGLADIQPGEGRVLSLGGQRLAVYRNGNGQLSALSPVCTHLGCLVSWNTTEQSWDCPCHGSRFDPHGRILNGPAVTALVAVPLPQEARAGEPPDALWPAEQPSE
jgi:glycine/D-amino acid oxidase-like deaminating enzyme/nitrite reductase/ring-hydroxylating ferredoxin subunit